MCACFFRERKQYRVQRVAGNSYYDKSVEVTVNVKGKEFVGGEVLYIHGLLTLYLYYYVFLFFFKVFLILFLIHFLIG